MTEKIGLKHHMADRSGDATDVGQTNGQQTREDRATQLLNAGWLSFTLLRDFKVLGSLWLLATGP